MGQLLVRYQLAKQLARPHLAGVDVEVVKLMVRVFFHRDLRGLQHMLVFAQDIGDAFAHMLRQALLAQAVVAGKGSKVIAGVVGSRGDGVGHFARLVCLVQNGSALTLSIQRVAVALRLPWVTRMSASAMARWHDPGHAPVPWQR